MASGYFQRLQEESRKFYQKLSRNQKWLLGGTAVLGLALLIVIAVWARQPQWSTLYAHLDSKDAGKIVNYLKDNDIPYQIKTRTLGSTIEVPADQVHELRLQMAAQDMPNEGGVVGFELFDKDNKMGMTNRVFDVNYQRALAGELARTIMQLDAVEKARVHLAIPHKQIFSQLDEPPTASVTLRLKPLAQLDEAQIKGISKLVAGSVPGLEQKHVTITDTAGNLLFDGSDQSPEEELAKLNQEQLKYQQRIEQEIRQNVERILGRVVGPGRVNVQVKASLDFDKEESVSKSYRPNDNQSSEDIRALRSEQQTSESGKGSEPVVGGKPGAETNIPGYTEKSTDNSNAQYNRKDIIRNYEVPEVKTTRVKDPGQITRLTLSVALDSQSPAINAPEGLDSNDPLVQNLRNLAIAAAGLDLKRGDTIAIYALPFDNTQLNQDRKAMEGDPQSLLLRSLLYGLGGLGVLFILFLLWLLLRRRQRESVEGENLEEGGFLPHEQEFPILEAPQDPEYLEAAARRAQAVKSLTEMAREDPSQVARLLKIWMQES